MEFVCSAFGVNDRSIADADVSRIGASRKPHRDRHHHRAAGKAPFRRLWRKCALEDGAKDGGNFSNMLKDDPERHEKIEDNEERNERAAHFSNSIDPAACYNEDGYHEKSDDQILIDRPVSGKAPRHYVEHKNLNAIDAKEDTNQRSDPLSLVG